MNEKLEKNGGFTLFETIVAVCILTIVVTTLSAGTVTSLKVYRQSTALSEATILSSTLFSAISDELRFATDVTTTPAGELDTFTSRNYGVGAKFSNHEADGRIKLSGGDIIGKMAYTNLQASATIYYDAGIFDVRILVMDPEQNFTTCSDIGFCVKQLNY